MYDIQFDIVARELVLTAPLFSGIEDFATTVNPSVQNGGICLFSRCANLDNPMFGVGMEEVMGANGTKQAYELNRWQAMVKNDGASIARWNLVQAGQEAFDVNVSYL